MEQLFYTSCRTGRSVDGGSGGFKLRAVSEGVSRMDLQKKTTWGYQLPDHTYDVESSPVRLAFLPFNEEGFSLIHTVYVGSDPDTGRAGNFFTHIVFTPRSLSSRDAISSWDSGDWQKEDGDFDSRLPSLELPPSPNTFTNSSESVSAFSQDPVARESITWLISAILAREGQVKQIILIGKSDYVAWLIHSALHLLPLQVCRSLTFSTYEKAPLTAPADIVGSEFPEGKSVPPTFFQTPNATLDTYNGRKTDLPVSDYSKIVEEGLNRGNPVPLFDMVSTLDQETNLDANLLEQLASVVAGKPLDRQSSLSLFLEVSGNALSSLLPSDEQWKSIAESICTQSRVSDELAARIGQMAAEGKSALHKAAFEQVADALRVGDIKRFESRTNDLIPLSGYPVTPDWVEACLEPYLTKASFEARCAVYHWLKDLPGLEESATNWLYSTPIPQIRSHCANRYVKRPEEYTIEVLSEALFRQAISAPAEVGKLLPNINEDIVPLLVRKFHQSQQLPESQKIQILQAVLTNGKVAGLTREKMTRFDGDPSSHNLHLKALYQIDPSIAAEARSGVSYTAGLDPELISQIDRFSNPASSSSSEFETGSSGYPAKSENPLIADNVPTIFTTAGYEKSLEKLPLDRAGLEKIECFVSDAQTKGSELDLAPMISRAIATELKSIGSQEASRPDKLTTIAEFLKEAPFLLQPSLSKGRSRSNKQSEKETRLFLHALLEDCSADLGTHVSTIVAASVAEVLSDSKIESDFPPLISFLKGMFAADSLSTEKVPKEALKLISPRARRIIKKHWKLAANE